MRFEAASNCSLQTGSRVRIQNFEIQNFESFRDSLIDKNVLSYGKDSTAQI